MFTFSPTQQSPGEIKGRELELGSRRELDNPLLQLFLSSCFSDTVFGLCSAQLLKQQLVKYTSCFAQAGSHLLNIILAVADCLFGLYGSERADKLFMSPPPPSPLPFPVL